jgi:hypothetical protein
LARRQESESQEPTRQEVQLLPRASRVRLTGPLNIQEGTKRMKSQISTSGKAVGTIAIYSAYVEKWNDALKETDPSFHKDRLDIGNTVITY